MKPSRDSLDRKKLRMMAWTDCTEAVNTEKGCLGTLLESLVGGFDV